MKKTFSISLTLFLIGILFVTIPFITSAQKLPNVQEKSLRAPSNIKIDGKPTEWNNQFQAYNKATEIFYTISNDNNNLYLTVQATDLDIVNKIICGGVTLTVQSADKAKKGMSITFPVIDLGFTILGYNGSTPVKVRYNYNPPINLDKPASWPADSFMVVVNKELNAKSTDIAVAGIEGIKDTISVYNPEGIKTSILVDNKTIMTYELAIPLKYLGLTVSETRSFVYNIKLNGYNVDFSQPFASSIALHLQRNQLQNLVRPNGGMLNQGYPPALRVRSLVSPTDFSGEYTLAK